MPEIVLECKADETLVKSLGYPHKMITHQPSRGEVINYLRKNPGSIGIVDDDPQSAKPNYFFKFQRETVEKFNVESFCINKLNTRLIIIKPKLEDWILKHAISIKINPLDYSFSDDGNKVHKIINSRLFQFRNMLNEMIERNSPALTYLKELIDKS